MSILRRLPLLALASAALAAEPGLFDYDKTAPLAIREVGVETRGEATVRDITFVGVKDPIKAYLVTPAKPGPQAAILYVHWFGDPATTNRTQFLNEAAAWSHCAWTPCMRRLWRKSGPAQT